MGDNVSEEVVKTFRQELPCQLTDSEIRDRQEQLVNSVNELRDLEDAKRTEVAKRNEVIKEKKGHVNSEAVILSKGEESRSVKCEGLFNYERLQYVTRRIDTGEELDSRAMTAQERQGKLKL